MSLCLWSPLYPLSKWLGIQGHAQNLEKQLWMEGRREVSITSHRPVTSSDLKRERLFFLWECLNIFATGCSTLQVEPRLVLFLIKEEKRRCCLIHIKPYKSWAHLFEGRLTLNLGFSFLCSKEFSPIILSVIFRAFNHQLVDKKN